MISISATKLIKKWPKTKKNDDFFTPNKVQTLKFMYPLQFLVSSTTNNKKSFKKLECIDIFRNFAAENTIKRNAHNVPALYVCNGGLIRV